MTFTTKYDIGQEVYYMHNNEIHKGKIHAFMFTYQVLLRNENAFNEHVKYSIETRNLPIEKYAKDIFPNAETLIHHLTKP